MDRVQQVFAIIALFQGGFEINLADGLTFKQCVDRIPAYMEAANNLKDTDMAIMCITTGDQFVTL